ncbi:hypothetical protein H8356DRAFT_1332154 [Neocallimastix lanati (nom. inval.)]|nr:hypothetical protein H8356DRAFT_1332154 [Neocallimastix sp. JGI-2020a]
MDEQPERNLHCDYNEEEPITHCDDIYTPSKFIIIERFVYALRGGNDGCTQQTILALL